MSAFINKRGAQKRSFTSNPPPVEPDPGGGGTPTPQPSTSVTVDDLVEDVWGPPKRTDGVATFNGIAPGRHEGTYNGVDGRLPGFMGPDFYVDWGDGAKYSPNIPRGKHINVWGHIYCYSTEKRFCIEMTYPEMWFLKGNLATGTWEKQTPPSPNSTNLYKQWISPSFKFEPTATYPVISELTTNPKGHRLDFSRNRPQTYSFFHWAWDTFFPRHFVPNDVVSISVQCAMRIVNTPSAPGVDLSTVNATAGISSDIYSGGANDSGGSANPAIGIPRYKRLKTTWREFGFTMMTEDQLRQNPPPRIVLPGYVPPPEGTSVQAPAQPTGAPYTGDPIFTDNFTGAALESHWDVGEPYQRSAPGFGSTNKSGVGDETWHVYPMDTETITVSNSVARLKARRRSGLNGQPTSAKFTGCLISTEGHFELPEGATTFTEIRHKVPSGTGIFTAWWLMGLVPFATDWREYDINEFVNSPGNPNTRGYKGLYMATAHWGTLSDHKQTQRIYDPPNGPQAYEGNHPLLDTYHTVGLYRSPTKIEQYINGVHIPGLDLVPNTVYNGQLGVPSDPVFTRAMCLRLDIKVGGDWAGTGLTEPQYEGGDYEVDYIRTWLISPGVSTTTFSESFNTNASSWPAAFTTLVAGGASTSHATVSGGLGIHAIAGGGYPEITSRLSTTSVNSTITWKTVHSDASEQYDQLILRGQGTWTSPIPATCYQLEISPQGGVWRAKLSRRNSGSNTDLTTQSGPATTNLSLSHKVDATDSTIRYKVWVTGQSEPGWLIEWTDIDANKITTAGSIGFATIGGSSGVANKQVSYDDIVVVS